MLTAQEKIELSEYNLAKMKKGGLDANSIFDLSNFLASAQSILWHLLYDFGDLLFTDNTRLNLVIYKENAKTNERLLKTINSVADKLKELLEKNTEMLKTNNTNSQKLKELLEKNTEMLSLFTFVGEPIKKRVEKNSEVLKSDSEHPQRLKDILEKNTEMLKPLNDVVDKYKELEEKNTKALNFINWYDNEIEKIRKEGYGPLIERRHADIHRGASPGLLKVTKTTSDSMTQTDLGYFVKTAGNHYHIPEIPPNEEPVQFCEKYLERLKKMVNDAQRKK